MNIEVECQSEAKPFIINILEICAKDTKFKITIKRRNKYKMPTYNITAKEEIDKDITKLILILLYHYIDIKQIVVIGKRGGRHIYPFS